METITSIHSAAPVMPTQRGRFVAPISAAQGTGVPFAGYGAALTATPDSTLGAVRNDGSRAPARGRPL